MSNAVVSTEKIVIKPEIIKSDVVLTSAELEQEREKYLKQIQKNISMPGFRPGKVPMGIIKRKYTNTAFYEGFENLLKEKTNEILTQQTFKPLYYVYNFENTDLVQDDGKDKKIELEYLLEPQVDINVKDREIQLVKYGFTESQRKIYSDILILFNFLNENPVEKLEHADQYFVITTEVKSDELSNAEDENKRKKANIPLVIHHYQF
ncbi:MAG: trigger factor family protein, partial [Bacteroidia bacterium]|nr:trigger factor family protein [Bacteroidia bacterium]